MSQISLIPTLKLEPESAAPIVSRRLFLHNNNGTGLPRDCQPFGLQLLSPSYDLTATPRRGLFGETPPLLSVNA